MKYLLLVCMISVIFPVTSNAQWAGVITGTSHKTDSGKYPYFFDDRGHPEVWSDDMQNDYDGKMASTIKELCSDQVSLGQVEKEYIAADQKDGNTLNSHIEIGKKMDSLKSEITRLSNIVVKGTGQSARVWGCQ